MVQENFEEYLRQKHIDPDAFQKAMPDHWTELKESFRILGAGAFDARKKFLLNNLRLQFRLPA